jgi:hypothetical protein
MISSKGQSVAQMFAGCPEFFQSFQASLCSTEAGRSVARENEVVVQQDMRGNWYVKNLPPAASRWRLAKAFLGLTTEGIQAETRDGYASQIRVAFAVQAFERYAEVYSKKWYAFYMEVMPEDNMANDIRSHSGFGEFMSRLIRVTPEERLKDRLRRFRDSETNQLYPLCHAIRHGFSHGTLRNFALVSDHSAGFSDHILSSVECHALDLVSRVETAS